MSTAKRGSHPSITSAKRGSISTESTRIFKGSVGAPRRSDAPSALDGVPSNSHPSIPATSLAVPRPPPPRIAGGARDASSARDASASPKRPSRIQKQRSISLTTRPEASLLLTPERRDGRRKGETGNTLDAGNEINAGNTKVSKAEKLKAKAEKIKKKIREKGLKEDEGEITSRANRTPDRPIR